METEILDSASPSFEKKTEDGCVFRIYRVGSLEVRSTCEHDGEETVAAVFAVRDKMERRSLRAPTGHEKIIKVTEYVEKISRGVQDAEVPECKYYAVLETQHGSTIVTEMIGDAVMWDENVADLEDRNSLAKVIRTASCRGSGSTVQELRNFHSQASQQRKEASRLHRSRTYATQVYTLAVGGVQAAMKATEQRQKAWETNRDSDEDDVELEKRVVDKVSAGGSMTLSPCSQCKESFVTGYKSRGGLWFCRACWKSN